MDNKGGTAGDTRPLIHQMMYHEKDEFFYGENYGNKYI